MNEIQVLDKRKILGFEVSTYGDIENPLFLAKDVARWIDHTDLSRMVGLVDEDEKLKRTLYVSGQNREMWFLTEDGLYEVLMQSRKPIAKEFKKKVKKLFKDLRLNKNPYQNLSTELKAIFILDKKQQETDEKVNYLYDVMTIDYEQQENLCQLAKGRAVEILGGKSAAAYKMVSKKLFQELWRDYKRYFKVNSYKNTARKDYYNAIDYLNKWDPSFNLGMEIDSVNAQMRFES